MSDWPLFGSLFLAVMVLVCAFALVADVRSGNRRQRRNQARARTYLGHGDD